MSRTDEIKAALVQCNCCTDTYGESCSNICSDCASELGQDLDALIAEARAEAIIEYKSKLKTDVCARAQNCYKGMFNEREQEIFNFATRTFLDAIDYFAEQLKE